MSGRQYLFLEVKLSTLVTPSVNNSHLKQTYPLPYTKNNLLTMNTFNNLYAKENPIKVPTNTKLTQLRKGLLEFLVLKIIYATKPSPSIQEIQKTLLPTVFTVKSNTLYPLLSKLYNEGLVTRGYEDSNSRKPRKYYYLTPKGIGTLQKLNSHWKSISITINSIDYFPAP